MRKCNICKLRYHTLDSRSFKICNECLAFEIGRNSASATLNLENAQFLFKSKEQRIAELEKENKELKNNQSKIALEKLYAIENILIDMHTNEDSFEDISESVSIMVSDMISKLEGGE